MLLLLSLGFLGFVYLGYPALMVVLARVRPLPVRSVETFRPRVTAIVAAHDAGVALARKIENLLQQDWPADRLDILIADDASGDGSPEAAARRWPDRVKVVRSPLRVGKPAVLVRAAAQAKGEILLLCDSRQRFEPDALAQLCAMLADARVGAVTGKLLLDGAGGVSAYWRYETVIRRAEGRSGSIPGVTGAIYAVRRSLFPLDMPAATILDDVYVPLRVALSGRRVVYADAAIAHDPELPPAEEMTRKVRTLAGNWQLPLLLPVALSPGNPLFFRFLAHKMARLFCPLALAGVFVGALRGTGLLAGLALIAQLAFYGAAIAEFVKPGSVGRAGKLALTFVVLNAAAGLGLWELLRGRASVTWRTTRAGA